MWALLVKLSVVNKEDSEFGTVGVLLSTAGGTNQQHHTDFHTSCAAYGMSVEDDVGTCSWLKGKVKMVKLEGPDRLVSRADALAWAHDVIDADADR